MRGTTPTEQELDDAIATVRVIAERSAQEPIGWLKQITPDDDRFATSRPLIDDAGDIIQRLLNEYDPVKFAPQNPLSQVQSNTLILCSQAYAVTGKDADHEAMMIYVGVLDGTTAGKECYLCDETKPDDEGEDCHDCDQWICQVCECDCTWSTCETCSERIHPDDLYSCSGCERDYCDGHPCEDCISCELCEEMIGSDSIHHCEGCDRYVCEGCNCDCAECTDCNSTANPDNYSCCELCSDVSCYECGNTCENCDQYFCGPHWGRCEACMDRYCDECLKEKCSNCFKPLHSTDDPDIVCEC